MQNATPQERAVAGGPIDWKEESESGVVKFSPHGARDPVLAHRIEKLNDETDMVTGPLVITFEELRQGVEMIREATDGEAAIGFRGFVTTPDHFDNPTVHVDGLLANPGIGERFSESLQLRFLKKYRCADHITVEDDALSVWYD